MVPRSIVCRTVPFEAGQERKAVAPLSKARLRSGSVGVRVTTTTAVRGEDSRMLRRSRRSLAPRGPGGEIALELRPWQLVTLRLGAAGA